VLASGLPEEATPYDLRHARINHLLDAGFTLPDVGFLVGHKRLTTTNEYASNERKALETKLFGAILGPLHNATIPKEVANMNDSAGAKEGGRTPTPFRALEPEGNAPDVGIEKPARFPWQRGQEGTGFDHGSGDSGAGPQIDPGKLAFGVDSLLDPDAYLAALAAERADDELLADGADVVRRALAAGDK